MKCREGKLEIMSMLLDLLNEKKKKVSAVNNNH
jgi:hypothetical protein